MTAASVPSKVFYERFIRGLQACQKFFTMRLSRANLRLRLNLCKFCNNSLCKQGRALLAHSARISCQEILDNYKSVQNAYNVSNTFELIRKKSVEIKHPTYLILSTLSSTKINNSDKTQSLNKKNARDCPRRLEVAFSSTNIFYSMDS